MNRKRECYLAEVFTLYWANALRSSFGDFYFSDHPGARDPHAPLARARYVVCAKEWCLDLTHNKSANWSRITLVETTG